MVLIGEDAAADLLTCGPGSIALRCAANSPSCASTAAAKTSATSTKLSRERCMIVAFGGRQR